MSQPRDMIFVVYAIVRPLDAAILMDVSAIVAGGTLAPTTHVAEPSNASLQSARRVGRAMRIQADAEGLTLRFAKLVWGSDLFAWAERADAKVALAPPRFALRPLENVDFRTGEHQYVGEVSS